MHTKPSGKEKNNVKIPSGMLTSAILSGGKGRRMQGTDKGLLQIGGKCLIEHLLDQLVSQCESIVISANRNLKSYAGFGYPVITDHLTDYQGPLAGMHAVMQFVSSSYILTLPCDTLVLPADYVKRMWNARSSAPSGITVAYEGERMQPVYALLPASLAPSLRNYLDSGERRIDRWYQQHTVIPVIFPYHADAFHNFNRPQDLPD